jgi:hypothetical protein
MPIPISSFAQSNKLMARRTIALGDRYDGKITVAPHRITVGAGRNYPQPKVINFD